MNRREKAIIDAERAISRSFMNLIRLAVGTLNQVDAAKFATETMEEHARIMQKTDFVLTELEREADRQVMGADPTSWDFLWNVPVQLVESDPGKR